MTGTGFRIPLRFSHLGGPSQPPSSLLCSPAKTQPLYHCLSGVVSQLWRSRVLGHHYIKISSERLVGGVSRTGYRDTRLLLLLVSSTFSLQALSLTKTDSQGIVALASPRLKTGLPGPNSHEQEAMQERSHSKSMKRLGFKSTWVTWTPSLATGLPREVKFKKKNEKEKQKNSPPASGCRGAHLQTLTPRLRQENCFRPAQAT